MLVVEALCCNAQVAAPRREEWLVYCDAGRLQAWMAWWRMVTKVDWGRGSRLEVPRPKSGAEGVRGARDKRLGTRHHPLPG